MINKKSITLTLFSLIFITVAYKSAELYSVRKQARNKVVKMPEFYVTNLSGDSTTISTFAESGKKTLLIYFDSKCSKCRDLISEFEADSVNLSHLNCFLLSAEGINEISEFRKALHKPEWKFFQVDPNLFFKTFGSLKTPQIFIYDEKKMLISNQGFQANLKRILSKLPK